MVAAAGSVLITTHAVKCSPGPSCVVLLRHGQREDYVAQGDGKGQAWINQTARPWDPPLAECGHDQARAAALRLREELKTHGLPLPTAVYASPLIRCVETAAAIADEFELSSILIEEGIAESVCEAWMRQWAVPGSDSSWGGPKGPHQMPKAKMHSYQADMQGPSCAEHLLRPEAWMGMSVLLRTAPELLGAGQLKVDPCHESVINLRDTSYRWGFFEIDGWKRILETLNVRSAEHKGETIVFVSHGGPSMAGFWKLVGKWPSGAGGMTALSVLRRNDGDEGSWQPLVDNDATHADALHKGTRTVI